MLFPAHFQRENRAISGFPALIEIEVQRLYMYRFIFCENKRSRVESCLALLPRLPQLLRQELRTCEKLPASSLLPSLERAESAMRFKSPAALLTLASSLAQPFASSAIIVPALALLTAPAIALAPAPPSASLPAGVGGLLAS